MLFSFSTSDYSFRVCSIGANAPFFVYSKSEYTLESVSVSGRLHDNSPKARPIVTKFSIQNGLINISVEFEDENDWSRNS